MFTIWGQILKKIHIKKLYNGFMVLGGVKSIGIINFAKCGEFCGCIPSITSMWDRVGQSAESSVQTGSVVEWLHVRKY